MRRLLILDDEPSVGKAIAFIATEEGTEALVTARPQEFFQELESWKPTHIALDLVMPGLDGVEIIRLLAERGCRARVIITSGIGGRVLDAARRTAEELGLNVTGVLPKPFSAVEIRAAMANSGNLAGEPECCKSVGNRPDLNPRDRDSAPFHPTAGALRHALDHGELEVFYQPSVTCGTLVLFGFEALVRWRHPVAGLILPDRFVPLAEATGLIDELTEQVVAQSLLWLSGCFPFAPVSLAVNISPRSLLNLQLGDRALHLTRQHRIDPARLTFELTESTTMENPVESLHLLTRLRTQGFQLSIDDFGTGYSSMKQLVRLPFSEMKVDKSFVIGAMHSQESRTVIRSIVDLGHSLGLRIAAEGVEDPETLAFLSGLQCDVAQGYYFAKPMPGPLVRGWAEDWKHSRQAAARSEPSRAALS